MTKRQQMRWSRATVRPFLDVRTAVLNGTLEDAFRKRHPGFRPANDERARSGFLGLRVAPFVMSARRPTG
jgi:hypothetical protein